MALSHLIPLSGPCLHAAYFHLKGSGGLGQACEGASAWELVFCYLGEVRVGNMERLQGATNSP